MLTVAQMQEVLSKHRHYKVFKKQGSVSIDAKELLGLIPMNLGNVKQLRSHIDKQGWWWKQIYGGAGSNVKIQYNPGYYDKQQHRKVKAWFSFEQRSQG